ncbi:hypothetical protein [Chamaesiphon sp.]|uniref:hypothetical protein n=1 Tax=Chamaesiphon sp. TaxID=2814140 RepID=UPI0035940CD9
MTRFKFRYLILSVIGVCLNSNIHPAQAQTRTIESTLGNSSIGSMPAYANSLRVNVPPEAQSSMGGVTSINCPAGVAPASCVPMSIWNTTFAAGELTPAQIATKNGTTVNPNSSLAKATPWLSRLKVGDIAATLGMAQMPVTTANGTRTTVGNLAATNPNATLGSVADLRKTSIAQFPQIQNIQLKQFPGISSLTANTIPGLSEVLISKMPGYSYPVGVAAIRLDLVRTRERNIRHMVISDNGVHKCNSNCDYGEFRAVLGLPYLNGARIISGDSQSVPGGYGALALMNGGREPAGVVADIGSGGVKFILTDVNAKKGTALIHMNTRVCAWLAGCSPYFIPIPLYLTISERDRGIAIPVVGASIFRQVRMP